MVLALVMKVLTALALMLMILTRAVEAPKKKAGKKAPVTGACRRLLRRLYIVNAA